MTLLHEDESLEVFLPREAFCKGHIIVKSKKDAIILEELTEEDLTKMLMVANKMCGVLFETLHCEGTNIMIQNGLAAGQVDESVLVHVIPRWQDDELDLEWNTKEANEAELENTLSQFSFVEDQRSKSEERERQRREVESMNTQTAEEISGDENYYVKQLRRSL